MKSTIDRKTRKEILKEWREKGEDKILTTIYTPITLKPFLVKIRGTFVDGYGFPFTGFYPPRDPQVIVGFALRDSQEGISLDKSEKVTYILVNEDEAIYYSTPRGVDPVSAGMTERAVSKGGIASYEVLRDLYRAFANPNYEQVVIARSLLGDDYTKIRQNPPTDIISNLMYLAGVLGVKSGIDTEAIRERFGIGKSPRESIYSHTVQERIEKAINSYLEELERE